MIKMCNNCGVKRNTNSRAELCTNCEKDRRKQHYLSKWKSELCSKGYEIIEFQVRNSHSPVTVKKIDCSHIFTAKLNNILSGMTSCGYCGPKTRIKPALSKYVEKYGRTYDLKEWTDYRRYVRMLSEQTYREHIDVLNPKRLNRSRPDLDQNSVQLDHIIPIIYGFKNGIDPELIADVRNLRIVDCTVNLQKKQSLSPDAKKVLQLLVVDQR